MVPILLDDTLTETELLDAVTESKEAAYESLFNKAKAIGAEHGKNAATWRFDGNTGQAEYLFVLKGIEEGDPLVMDTSFLSGEWAGTYDMAELANDLGVSQDSPDFDALCIAYQDAASDGYWDEVERVARYMTER
jgi:hypothetical protein